MAEMVKRKVQITIDKKGAYTMKALEGFSGESCVNNTKNIELVLGEGATEVGSGKTDAYYDGDGDAPISINLGN